jgi:hypothetical protein
MNVSRCARMNVAIVSMVAAAGMGAAFLLSKQFLVTRRMARISTGVPWVVQVALQ